MEAIDEVRQEVFTRCIAGLGELRDARKLGAFVNAICNRVLMEYYRAEGRTETLDEQSDFADTSDLEASFDSARNVARVRRVLATLPPRDAEILRAVFIDEGNKEEVCRRLGIERDYLRVLIHRAKEKFRTQYLRRKSGRISLETFGGQSTLPV
jgi:RNA polymerase sigma-70 factor (ECF subfamily)